MTQIGQCYRSTTQEPRATAHCTEHTAHCTVHGGQTVGRRSDQTSRAAWRRARLPDQLAGPGLETRDRGEALGLAAKPWVLGAKPWVLGARYLVLGAWTRAGSWGGGGGEELELGVLGLR